VSRNTDIHILKEGVEVTYDDLPKTFLWHGDVEKFIDILPEIGIFDLVFTSPPYNIGKQYEKQQSLEKYLEWQSRIISKIAKRLKPTGSICWQVGNFVRKGKGAKSSTILPLDILFHDIFTKNDLQLRNRVIWHFEHGLNCSYRFSGRYETVMWYTKSDNYLFNLDAVRVPQKYPGKRHFKGPNLGKLSCNPKGKNPSDIWSIPNVKSNHVEKTDHPCQFPVALVQRFILSLTEKQHLVFDPFSGVASTGVAALLEGRHYWGCEIHEDYIGTGKSRLEDTMAGQAKIRPFDKPIYDEKQSNLSRRPPA